MSTPQALSNALKGLMRRVPQVRTRPGGDGRLGSADTQRPLLPLVPSQPVSIATVKIDTPFPHYHGATLSSLTSVALAPLPLVAFSLRLPSRLAAAIGAPASSATGSSPSASSEGASSLPKEANIVLHYLSSSQMPLAASFAKALPAPIPTSGASASSGSPASAASPFALHPFNPSAEGIPVLGGCIGAISCRVLGSVPLSATGLASVGFSAGSLGGGSEAGWDGEATSELYVAEVVRVEESLPLPPLAEAKSSGSQAGGLDADAGKGLPLVYHDQRYCGVGDIGRT